MTSADSPIVFIVDDDTRMRAAMQRLLKTVGLAFRGVCHAGGLSTAQASRWSQLPPPGCAAAWNERAGGPK